jgi:hypothetical protein
MKPSRRRRLGRRKILTRIDFWLFDEVSMLLYPVFKVVSRIYLRQICGVARMVQLFGCGERAWLDVS